MVEKNKNYELEIANLWRILESVKDPEIPVISIRELGILRNIYFEDGEWVVVITPTYSGCPAMGQIKDDVKTILDKNDIKSGRVEITLSPAWSTDWITEEGKEKLKEYGIAPPSRKSGGCPKYIHFESARVNDIVACPHCGSKNTMIISEFGSTACKALYRCSKCLEPFDYFKPH